LTEFLNIAHRGASVDAPENTLTAFGLALDQGADMIETDLHLLRDGAIALYHDEKIEGVAVGTFTLAELREHLPDAPTLQESLDAFGRRIPFNLELKRSGGKDYEGLEELVLEEVRSRNLLGQTLFSSFHDSILSRVRRLESQARIGVLVSPRAPRNIEKRARLVRAEACHLYVSLATRLRVAELHDEGYRVHVFTVDEPDAQTRLLEFGVDGIFTNVPAKLRALLVQ
jgi:glycerophosphoryl diester phosphodiesterase